MKGTLRCRMMATISQPSNWYKKAILFKSSNINIPMHCTNHKHLCISPAFRTNGLSNDLPLRDSYYMRHPYFVLFSKLTKKGTTSSMKCFIPFKKQLSNIMQPKIITQTLFSFLCILGLSLRLQTIEFYLNLWHNLIYKKCIKMFLMDKSTAPYSVWMWEWNCL